MTERSIWVFLERKGDEVEDTSLEILGKARELSDSSGMPVTGIVPGNMEDGKLRKIINYGADKLINLNDGSLNSYSTDLYVHALQNIIRERMPEIFLIGATPYGRDLAGRLAARLKTGLTANAVTLDVDDKGILVSGVPAYGGKIIAEIVCEKSRPQMATVRPGTFRPYFGESRNGEIITVKPDISGIKDRVAVKERKISEFLDLTKSRRTVIAGNGTRGDLKLVREFADSIGADIGVTRPLADRGLISRDFQVGSTGYSLRSEIAVILGVSGSEHFTSGIKDCRTVISIDTNPKAEIFQHSDYCIVGDIFDLIPKAIEMTKVKM
jgi:electron transfer flavoprotein alpha subunit